MKRYYLSKIKSVDIPGMGIVNRHRLQELPGVDYVGGEIKVDPVTGIPTEKALLVLVGSINHKRFKADPELIPLPDVAKDMKVSAIHTKTKLDCKAAIKALGFSDTEVEDVFNGADGIRDVLAHFGRKNRDDFDPDDFDLDES